MLNISKIRDIINNIIKEQNINREDLYNNGAIYYMNGNDGTDFDYNCNNMTSEFYVFWKNEAGAIKLNQRGDTFVIFVYEKENPYSGNYKKIEINSPFDLYELCCYLKGDFDDNLIFDEEITNWILENKSYISQDDEEIW